MVMHGRVWGAYKRGPRFQAGLDLQSVNDPLNHAARLTDPIWRRFQAVRAAAAPELPPGVWDNPSLPVPPDLPPADPATFRESIQRVTNAANAQLTEMERVRASLENLMAELTAAEQQVRRIVKALEQTVEATRAGLDDENAEGDYLCDVCARVFAGPLSTCSTCGANYLCDICAHVFADPLSMCAECGATFCETCGAGETCERCDT